MNIVHRPIVMLVPYWVRLTLARNKLSKESLLDFNKVKTVFSLEDIAAIYFLNKNNPDTGTVDLLDCCWTDPISRQFVENNVIPLSSIAQDSITNRLMSEYAINSYSKRSEDESGYDIEPVVDKGTTFIVTLRPGSFSSETHNKLCVDILKMWLAYTSYDNMANTSMFTRYMDGL